jgi:hypothetical protein
MKKKLLLFCLIPIAFSIQVSAQTVAADSAITQNRYQNSAYLEIGGNALIGSLNYEFQYKWPSTHQAAAFRVGGAYWPYGKADYGNRTFHEHSILIPLEATMIYGKRSIKVEGGFGITLIYDFEVEYDYDIQDYKRVINRTAWPTFRIGGRWQPTNKPYFLRAGAVILVPESTYFYPPVLPYGGLSFGYSFGRKKCCNN